jgi:hypothetical protein
MTRERRIKSEFRDACKGLAASFSASGISALDMKHVEGALDAYDWAGFETRLTAFFEQELHSQLVSEAVAESIRLRRMGKALRGDPKGRLTINGATASWRLDRTDPRMVEWAQTRSSKLVTQISKTTRGAIRKLIGEAYTEGRSVYDTARLLRTIVGPLDSQVGRIARAYGETVDLLRESGLTFAQAQEKAAKQAERVTDRAVASRAETIARTEIITAGNQGRIEAWSQAIDAGLLPSNAHKEWVAFDPCPECEGLDGEVVPYDEPFSSGDDGPAAHPNCRCAVVYVDDPNDSTLNIPGIDGGA